MEQALNEVKIQAKKILKGYKNKVPEQIVRLDKWHKTLNSIKSGVQLKHCQVVIAKELGFRDWQHLHKVLSGEAVNNSDVNFGSLFYNKACVSFVNQWFTTYGEAKVALDIEHYLLPFKRQFLVVGANYITMLGVTNGHKMLQVKHDLYASYPSNEWDELVLQTLKHRQ